MIKFEVFTLDNGLKVLVNQDLSTPLVAMNILYNVGSKDEDPDRTGLAHLFEHLMFSGSVNIPEFDPPLQLAGGENNAFTNNDITNYYLTLPYENLETGFWLESDRMLGLNLTEGNIEIQKSVVVEEFKQRYINQPYGDVMHLLRPLTYKIHPYKWPPIGVDISHIATASLEHVSDFFFSHYAPNNAILSLSGKITPDEAYRLSNKWFGPVEKRELRKKNITPEPEQTEERKLSVLRNVPVTALYKAWHVCKRTDEDFYTLDLLTDILAGGESGRLYSKLVREKGLFSEVNAWLTSDIDPGLVIFQGRLMNNVDIEVAEQSLNEIIDELKHKEPETKEMEKVKNRYESATVISNSGILNKAMNLAYYELLGNPELINSEIENFCRVSPEMVKESAIKYLNPSNCSTVYYISERGEK
ncbi:MAG: insulinase family protein [Bacteroidales bacterium]|nr:insulinase family protein [Bacteroidales bacterium]